MRDLFLRHIPAPTEQKKGEDGGGEAEHSDGKEPHIAQFSQGQINLKEKNKLTSTDLNILPGNERK